MRLRPLTAARLAASAVALSRLIRAARTRLPVAPTDGAVDRFSISVVVPARDEGDRLAPSLESLASAGVAELIVVDDQSEDDTASIAVAAGASVVAGRPRPPGWAGKPWALQQGLETAGGDWIVALDADARPDPRLPHALVARAVADRADLLSVAGRFEGTTAGARWLHPAMLTTLVYRFGPPGATGPGPGRLMANGQCMVFRRERLLAEGGFRSIAGELVEDVALVRELAGRGWSVDFLDATGLLSVRMYESLADTWRGWGRSLGLPGIESGARRVGELAMLTVTVPLPLFRLLARRGDPLDGLLLLVRIGTLVGTRRAYERGGPAYWLSPLADAVAVAAVAVGTVRRRHVWRGRTYG